MVEQKLAQMGLALPVPPKPVAAYVPGIRVGNLIYTSGQIPFVNGELPFKGRLGESLSVAEGYEAARVCALNCLGVVKALAGDLDKVRQIVRVTGYVSSADNFTDQPKVVNGASELLQVLFGERGQHARTAVGVNTLPLNAACEVELIVLVAD